MDISKLPRMSHTPPPAAKAGADQAGAAQAETDQPAAAQTPVPPPGPAIAAGPEAWISIAIGVILLLWNNRLLRYLADPSTTAYDAIRPDGTKLPYVQSVFLPFDLGFTLFAVALIVEGLVLLLARGRGAVMAAAGVMALAAAANIWALAAAWPINGFQLQPAVFAALAIYIVLYQARTLRGA